MGQADRYIQDQCAENVTEYHHYVGRLSVTGRLCSLNTGLQS